MTVSTSPSKHTVHSPFLMPAGSGGENTGDTGGLSGELGAVTAEREKRTYVNNVSRVGSVGATPRMQCFLVGPVGGHFWEILILVYLLGFAPFSTLLLPNTKIKCHHCHPLEYPI